MCMCGAVGTLICRSGYDALLLSYYGRRGTVFLDDGAPATWLGEGCSWAQQEDRGRGLEALLDPGDVVGLARVGLRIVAVVIADNALRYTDVIAFNVPLFE